jgi:hypothetical protein
MLVPVEAGLDGFVTDSCSQGSEQAVLRSNRATGLSLGVSTSNTITVENGLTKSQKWLIEWLREGVKDDEPHMVILKDMEEDYRWANKVAHNGELSPNPPDRVLHGDEEDRKLALLNEVKKNCLRDTKVVQPRTKGKRELLNLESSINYSIASGPTRRRARLLCCSTLCGF